MLSYAHKLLNTHHAFYDDVVFNHHMACDISRIGEDDSIANLHVVRDMHIGHEQAV